MNNIIETITETQDFLNKNGLNWNTELVQEVHPITHNPINSYATMRSDNQQILKTGLSKTYKPIQNSQIAEMAKTLSKEFNIKTKRVEVIEGGKKIIIQVTSGLAEIGDRLTGNRADFVALRTTFLHDNTGAGALKFTPSPFRLICKNQLAIISKFNSRYIRDVNTQSIHHNSRGQIEIKNILETGNTIASQNQKTIETFNAMAKKTLTNYDIKDIVESMVKELDYDNQVKFEIERLIFDADNGQSDPNNAWGVYNGITRYNDHFSGRKNPSTNNLVFGSIAKKNEIALDHILNYVGGL